MKPHRRAVLSSLAALSTTLGLAGLGCTRPAPATPAASTAKPPSRTPAPSFESSVPPAAPSAERGAQRAWCAYLDALYHRATQDGAPWSELARCNTATSTAAPEMLERTAACSQAALDGFDGDPFTDAYAAEVKACGTTTLEAMALPIAEVDPYVAAVCDRASTCGRTNPKDSDCRVDLSQKLGKRLGRAVGALNPESRIAFRRAASRTRSARPRSSRSRAASSPCSTGSCGRRADGAIGGEIDVGIEPRDAARDGGSRRYGGAHGGPRSRWNGVARACPIL